MIKMICKIIGGIYYKINKVLQQCKNQYILSKMNTGANCHIGSNCTITHPRNIILGNNVWIGDGCLLMCAKASLKIGSHVMIAPNVTIVTGTHRINQIGEYMDNIKQKEPENDVEVVIDDDVWIGSNAIILKGVTIGKGSVIGAGSIISKNVEPYSVYYPTATTEKRKRFTQTEIEQHEAVIESNNHRSLK